MFGQDLKNNQPATRGDIKESIKELLQEIRSDFATKSDVREIVGEIKLPAKFRLQGIARGLDIEVNDVNAKLYDIEAALHYDFNRFFRASAGYRYFMIKAEDNSTNDSVDIKFTGPYVGVTGSF